MNMATIHPLYRIVIIAGIQVACHNSQAQGLSVTVSTPLVHLIRSSGAVHLYDAIVRIGVSAGCDPPNIDIFGAR